MHVNKKSKGSSFQRCGTDARMAKHTGRNKSSLFSKWYRPQAKVLGKIEGTWTYLPFGAFVV